MSKVGPYDGIVVITGDLSLLSAQGIDCFFPVHGLAPLLTLLGPQSRFGDKLLEN